MIECDDITTATNISTLILRGESYTLGDIDALRSFLTQQGTFDFPILPSGLFPAARLVGESKYTGYDNVWVRDNIHIALAHYIAGRCDIAVRTVKALCTYFQKHSYRLHDIIRGDADPSDPMNRPHVRFDGSSLKENAEKWSHAQNDALGYFCWLYCLLALDRQLEVHADDWNLMALFALYFERISYWEDEDSGHWEEARKVSASSIGTVVAGLRALRRLMASRSLESLNTEVGAVTLQMVDALVSNGVSALRLILPNECVQLDPEKRRRFDSALLFLIYPLNVATEDQANQILSDVGSHLTGEHGIRRYLGDSFWCADYKSLRRPEERTADMSDNMSARDILLKPGEEAQWCIFDPIVSAAYGRRYQRDRDPRWLRQQRHHLNRSLSQLTSAGSGFPEWLCPELYFLQDGVRVPNDVTPLLWTQANLIIALYEMQRSGRLA